MYLLDVTQTINSRKNVFLRAQLDIKNAITIWELLQFFKRNILPVQSGASMVLITVTSIKYNQKNSNIFFLLFFHNPSSKVWYCSRYQIPRTDIGSTNSMDAAIGNNDSMESEL